MENRGQTKERIKEVAEALKILSKK